ncbi:hypothetical protein BE221DRAFT_204383 [Ostreococcus tauri]|uniref:Uncharacterized protein n=1 Tax=Ostreococcus tauri TaxID=70448 RepID=A0A1Y5IHP8_OSTTA|nr:hypothetical protein BE221DRAFT_204383 [Ostreococcus tauri]
MERTTTPLIDALGTERRARRTQIKPRAHHHRRGRTMTHGEHGEPKKHGFFARFFFGKSNPRRDVPLPGYIEEMYNPRHHTEDSRNDLGEFIRRRSMDERRVSTDSTPRTSEVNDDA